MSRSTRHPQDSDAAWIIALWHALHGADAALEDVAAEVTAIFSQYLPGSDRLTLAELNQSVQTFPALDSEILRQATTGDDDAGPSAFDLAVEQEKANEMSQEKDRDPSADESDSDLSIHHYYFKFKGRTYCFDLPALTYSPAAA